MYTVQSIPTSRLLLLVQVTVAIQDIEVWCVSELTCMPHYTEVTILYKCENIVLGILLWT